MTILSLSFLAFTQDASRRLHQNPTVFLFNKQATAPLVEFYNNNKLLLHIFI